MIRIQVTSPFRYQYFNADNKLEKDHYLAAGNYYHLDPVKDLAEIKFVLSPNFTFKNYIYVHEESLPSELVKELQLETGLYADNVQLSYSEEHIPTLIKNNSFIDASENYQPSYTTVEEEDLYFKPAAEPSANPFDLTTPSPIKEEEKVEIVEEAKEEEVIGALNTPDVAPLEELPTEIEDIETSDVTREARKKELTDMHYSKVKEVAELYNLEYTTKKETVSAILALEFNDDTEALENVDRKLEPLV